VTKPVRPWLASLLHVVAPPTDPVVALLGSLFPSMVPRDVAVLRREAATRVLAPDESLYAADGARDQLYCIVVGELVEHVREGDLRQLTPHSLVGEAGWLVRRAGGAAAPDLRATQVTSVLSWRYADLDRLVAGRAAFAFALTEGMALSLANPGELVDPPAGAAVLEALALRRLHDIAFPSLDAGQFGLLQARGEQLSIPAGSILDTRQRVAVITSGTVRISRADGHYLDLGEGSFLGELGWAAPDRVGKEYVVVKTATNVEMLRWSYQQLADLGRISPRLYAGVVHGIARDVAVKLSLPMQKVRVIEEAKAMSA